jgi:hypothetical protein
MITGDTAGRFHGGDFLLVCLFGGLIGVLQKAKALSNEQGPFQVLCNLFAEGKHNVSVATFGHLVIEIMIFKGISISIKGSLPLLWKNPTCKVFVSKMNLARAGVKSHSKHRVTCGDNAGSVGA